MISETVHRSTVSRRKRGVVVPRAQYKESISLLTYPQQKALISYINKCSARGLPPTVAIVRNIVEEIA
jgi:hypothetical protein